MKLPYHVSCSQSSVPLYQLADGRFQLTKEGPIAPFMDGPGYFLMEHALAGFLYDLDIPGIRFETAVIWHRSIDQEFATHLRLFVETHITVELINDLNLDGRQFYALNDECLFASPDLKEILALSPFTYLRFSEGLSRFC